jgi:tetratricopeptide (TPR) repeat protein
VDEQITLTAYSDQIRDLIRNDRNDEAIAIGKHILRYYPKYVDVYVHLGQALLEKGRYADAKEMFRRALSADPENIVAYAGLAILLEQEQLIAEAVWHMERAYELSPDNIELHQELQRLYHELDGRPRARLKLTPGGLARLHIQEGLFTQAIQELNAIVATDEKRLDARVALAQTLWQAGQMRPAAETAQAILRVLPYCLKANLILGAVWKEIGLAESEQYLQRAQELDPTNRVAHQIFGSRSPLPLAEPRVPRYVEGAPIAVPTEPTVAELAIEETPSEPLLTEAPVLQPPVTETTLPPWLTAPTQAVVETPPVVEEPQPEAEGELPDWLARLREPTEPTAPVAETEGELPPWMRAEPQAAPTEVETPLTPPAETAEESALPPWLAEMARAEQPVSPPPPTEPAPAWFQQLETPTEPAREETPAREEELPPWLAQPTPTIESPRAEAPTRAEALPPWLAQPAQPTEPSREQPPARAEELPSWITQPTPTTEPSREQPPARTEELPSWITQPTPTTEPSREQPPVRAEELPSWITQPTPTTEPPRQVPTRAEELPPWARQPEPTPSIPTEPAPPPTTRRAPARKAKSSVRGESHLILARAYRDANQIAEALREYDYVVQKAPRLVKEVIADLEVLAKRPGVPLDVHRILGDAYTRADRLAEALAEYRLVLERVSS